MKKIFVVNKPANTAYVIPLLWISAKTYYEEYGKHSDKWTWSQAILDYSDFDKLFEQIIKERPKVVGFSSYIWNESYQLRMAKKIKQELWDTVIVWGGPQCDIQYNKEFFKQHPYIDLVIPSDAYGERSLSDILDNIIDNDGLLAEKIEYSYRPTEDRKTVFNNLSPNKKEFNWPSNPFKAQEEHLLPFFEKMHRDNLDIKIMMETSRGCPYKCTFCDWGGGIFTKTVKKPFATVMNEIDWMGRNKIPVISFTDANFGMFSIDVEYAKQAVMTKKKFGYPRQVILQPTKVKLEQLTKIYEMLAEADMLAQYQISIQDINEDVKKNVERVDFPFEDQVAMFRKLQKKKDLPIYIEGILGLPGASMTTVKENIDKITKHDLPILLNHHWALLPATPANDPEYRTKYELMTVIGKASNGLGFSTAIMARPGMEPDSGVTISSGEEDSSEYVVGTFSYSPRDWIDMNLLQIFASIMMNGKMTSLLARYLYQEHGIPHGDFFEKCLKDILDDEVTDRELQEGYHGLRNKFRQWLYTKEPDLFMVIHDDINFKVSPPIYYLFVTLTLTKEFFDSIRSTVGSLISLDPRVMDLIGFCQDRIIDINYSPGKTFENEYDWLFYEQYGKIKRGRTKYRCDDTHVFTGGQTFDMNWIKETGAEKIKQFIYRYCYDFKTPKVSKNFTIMSIHDMKSTATF